MKPIHGQPTSGIATIGQNGAKVYSDPSVQASLLEDVLTGTNLPFFQEYTDAYGTLWYEVTLVGGNNGWMKEADAAIITMTPIFIDFPPTSLADAILTIDAGHGGMASGATSSDGQLLEKDVNLKIALELQRLLQEQGVGTIWMTRIVDEDVSLAYRADLATASGGHLFISIHNNDGPTGAHGTETYYQCGNEQTLDTKQKSQDLALEVQNNLLLAVDSCTPSYDRGIKCRLWGKRDYYYVLRNTMIPAVLAECTFMSDPLEVNCLKQDLFLTSLAEGIQDGILAFLT